jgi:hypothetical protein
LMMPDVLFSRSSTSRTSISNTHFEGEPGTRITEPVNTIQCIFDCILAKRISWNSHTRCLMLRSVLFCLGKTNVNIYRQITTTVNWPCKTKCTWITLLQHWHLMGVNLRSWGYSKFG